MQHFRTIKELVIQTCVAEGHFPSYEMLTAMVTQHFPDSKWKKTHYAWYKSKIKTGEIQVPGISGLRSIETEVPTLRSQTVVREVPSQRRLQNRYRITRKMGAGGMGSVYEAIDERLKCLVAVKQMSTERNLRARDFEREASLLANLSHPALPRVSDHFVEDDGQFLVMQHVPGDDLQQSLEKRGAPFPVSDVLEWANQLLDVLEYLHGNEPPVIHRDIKPSNIKIDRGRVMLLDFGLAKGALGQMETLTNTISILGGTPLYSPLEQFFGEGTDPRSDIYSLGATLYELITGSKPIAAMVRFGALENDDPDPLATSHQLNPTVPSRISDVIAHSMAIRRKDRLQSAGAMRDALRGKTKAITRSPSKRRRWDETSFFADASNRGLSPDHLAALRQLFDWSKEHADNIRFGDGVDSGSFNPKFMTVCPRSVFTARSDGALIINFQWLTEPESAKTWREQFGHALKEKGFSIPFDFAKRYVRLPDKEWVSRLDDFLKILKSKIEIDEAAKQRL